MAPNTYGNVSVREGYLKGQSTMGKKWIVNSTVTIEQGKMLYSTPTVKIIFDNGSGIKKELGNIVYWRDNECIRSKKKINPLVARFGIKTKPNRIDLLSRLGNVIISLSAADENTYSYIKNTLRSLIGSARCEIRDTRSERQRKGHLASLRRGGRRRKRRKRTRKHKKRKMKRKSRKKKRKRRKTKKRRRKKGGSDPEKDNCPICLDPLKGNKPIIDVHKKPGEQEKEKTAGAGKHYFHLDCVNQLKRSVPGNNKCPSCRQDMSYFEKLVDNNNNNNHDPEAPLGRHGQRLARQGAIIAHDARRRLRLDPIAGRRAARERLEAESRSGRGLGGGKR